MVVILRERGCSLMQTRIPAEQAAVTRKRKPEHLTLGFFLD